MGGLKKTLGCGCLVLFIAWMAATGIAVLMNVRPTSKVNSVALPPPSLPVVEPSSNLGPSDLKPGDIVDILKPTMFSERAFANPGVNLRTLKNGEQKFAGGVGNTGLVVGGDSAAVKIRLHSRGWEGREGWIPRASVRKQPTEEESTKDVEHGLTLLKRREIYAELHRVGSIANLEADRRVPQLEPPFDQQTLLDRERRRQECYEAFEKELDRQVMDRYGLSINVGRLIYHEGEENTWPWPEVRKSDLPPIDQVQDPRRSQAPAPQPVPHPQPEPEAAPFGEPIPEDENTEPQPKRRAPEPKKKRSKPLAETSTIREASNAFRAARLIDSQGEAAKAVEAYRKFLKDYPNAEAAGYVKTRLKALTGSDQ
ncbi:hypothetical protein [Singulisphaera sp. PoT]|uniref:hypothetical protein n=1 Tax=Singulisphaera sp. PoT TaxID=3411797 RepID=UPI003BF4DADE